MPKLKNSFRPAPGSSIKVDPIRDREAIHRIKLLLQDDPRNLCLFTLGINTAYRANELLSISVGRIRHMRAGDRIDLKQCKTSEYRDATLNQTTIDSVQDWMRVHPNPTDDRPLFISRRGNNALCVSSVNHLVKSWCREIGLAGNYGSHSLRKTWGYQQRMISNTPVPLLMVAYGHPSEAQTLRYLGIQADEIRELFDLEL